MRIRHTLHLQKVRHFHQIHGKRALMHNRTPSLMHLPLLNGESWNLSQFFLHSKQQKEKHIIYTTWRGVMMQQTSWRKSGWFIGILMSWLMKESPTKTGKEIIPNKNATNRGEMDTDDTLRFRQQKPKHLALATSWVLTSVLPMANNTKHNLRTQKNPNRSVFFWSPLERRRHCNWLHMCAMMHLRTCIFNHEMW